jgi:hypothetical protein
MPSRLSYNYLLPWRNRISSSYIKISKIKDNAAQDGDENRCIALIRKKRDFSLFYVLMCLLRGV